MADYTKGRQGWGWTLNHSLQIKNPKNSQRLFLKEYQINKCYFAFNSNVQHCIHTDDFLITHGSTHAFSHYLLPLYNPSLQAQTLFLQVWRKSLAGSGLNHNQWCTESITENMKYIMSTYSHYVILALQRKCTPSEHECDCG